ncbi:MAG: prephenate dehydrogenase/arogenate dehydrogenase family protein [Solirubrobacteraceae bacterium]
MSDPGGRSESGPLRVAVIGVGLIGGSIGLAARHRLGAHVVGYDADAEALSQAMELGAIERRADNVASAVGEADYVFVATPVGHNVEVVREALAASGRDCVVSDVGSTKRHVAREISDARFVPGHPLAGGETAGVEGAREGLFDEALWYLAPVADADTPEVAGMAAALARISALIEQIGARPVVIAADAHDRLMASVSHLPHVLANVLVSQALRAAPAAVAEPSASLGHSTAGTAGMRTVGANPSFRDATRVAGANTAIWADIYMSNADLLAEALDETIRELSGVRDALDAEDADALVAWNERVREERERLTGS